MENSFQQNASKPKEDKLLNYYLIDIKKSLIVFLKYELMVFTVFEEKYVLHSYLC